jgi:hypothetical protein
MVEREQEEGFHQLRLDGGRADGHDRLAREDRRALGHGPDVAHKMKMAQIVEEALAELVFGAQIGDIVIRKMQVLQILHRLLQPRRNGEAAVVRHVAEKDVEIDDAVLQSALIIPVAHRELVKVAEHREIQFLVFVRHGQPLAFFICGDSIAQFPEKCTYLIFFYRKRPLPSPGGRYPRAAGE